MLVVIEGPDRTGKTTLADKLSAEFSWSVLHASQPRRHPLQEYVLQLENVGSSDFAPQHLILDRWHLGEWVYPQLYPEGRRPLEMPWWLWIELYLRALHSYLIVMLDDPHRIRTRVAADRESYLKTPETIACTRLFKAAFQQSLLDKLPYAGNLDLIDGIVHRVGQLDARRRAPEPYTLGYPPGGRNGILLVGDELGTPNPPEATHEVPFAPYPQSSGWYLMQAILRWETHDQLRAQIVNSLDPFGQPTDLEALCARFRPARVVALGQRAADRLSQAGVSHARLRHPQYVRRFEHSRLASYSDQLLQERMVKP